MPPHVTRRLIRLAAFVVLFAGLTSFGGREFTTARPPASSLVPAPALAARVEATEGPEHVRYLPNVYSATMAGSPNAAIADLPPRVYVPNSDDGTVDVIDAATLRMIDRLTVGGIPHHIAPSWDLTRLHVDVERLNVLAALDPRTGKAVSRIPIADPYNLYYTPDGTKAIVAAEVLRRLDFVDPHTWKLIKSVPIPWPGVDHLDFSADGSFLLASTEFSGMVVKVDTASMEVAGAFSVGGLPVDVRLSPDGTVFYVANQGRHGVSIVDPVQMKEIGFLPTGRGAHGLQVSRDTRYLYVSNRLAGSISLIDFATRQVAATWLIGGSPDMMQVSPDGKQLWVSGRFDRAVYVVDTGTGTLQRTIRVGRGPHGLCYFPNLGRFSLGHNGVYR